MRFAQGEISTGGESSDRYLAVRSSFGRRSGDYVTNQIDPDSIEAAVRSAEAIARLAPDDPEFVPPLGAQVYSRVEGWAASTAEADASRRAALAAAFIEPARSGRLIPAGACEVRSFFLSVATSAGLFAWHRGTLASLSGTVRTPGGSGSGWAGAASVRIEDVDAGAAGRIAARKAVDSAAPEPIPPGLYTVVLEPKAVADLIPFLLPALDARRIEEGLSPFSRPGGGSAVGERIAAQGVTLRSDPARASAPSIPFDGEGSPVGSTTWIEDGILRATTTARYWAGKGKLAHRPPPTNLLMGGGPTSLDAMIRATDRGLLVTRLWYVRPVDSQRLRLTGLTRDGLFLIEGGRVTRAVRNLRFNGSPLQLLQRADMIGEAKRVHAGPEREGLVIEAPALRSGEFTFTSASDAV